MFQEIRVYDVDGVLVDSSHRYRNLPDGSIDLTYWKDNAHKVNEDTLLPHVAQYRADCKSSEIYVIVCTARELHPRDLAFITGTLGKPNKIIMRPIGDNTPDAILKTRALSRLFNLRQFAKLPRFLFEDNPRNIAALSKLFTRAYYIPSQVA